MYNGRLKMAVEVLKHYEIRVSHRNLQTNILNVEGLGAKNAQLKTRTHLRLGRIHFPSLLHYCKS
jgi:hypothetical protein